MKCIEKRVLFMGKRNKVTTREYCWIHWCITVYCLYDLKQQTTCSFSKETIDKVRQGAKELGYKKPVAGVKKERTGTC